MHYKNGREAKNGDKIVMVQSDGKAYAGILYDAVAGNDHCNGRIATLTQNDTYCNLSECLRADDVGFTSKFIDNPDSPVGQVEVKQG